MQTVLLTEKARIIDVVTILQFEDHALLIASPGAATAVIQWLRKYVIMEDVRFKDITSEKRIIEICGPAATEAMNSMLNVNVSSAALYDHLDVESMIVTRMPSFDEVSYWVLGDINSIQHVVDVLRENSKMVHELSIKEAERKRIMAGIGKRDAEFTDAYNPLEAGLLHLTSFTKGCYLGQEVVARLDSYNKVKQRLMGFVGSKDVVPGDQVKVNDELVGRLTSVERSDDGLFVYALGYIRNEHAHPGSNVSIEHEGSNVDMQLYLLPMVI